MKANKAMSAILCLLAFIAVLIASPAFAAEEMTIQGVILEEGMIITGDGEQYAIAENDLTAELMENVGQQVEATGAVTEEEGQKTIAVTSYELIQAEGGSEGQGGGGE
ncbi:MAG: hypothetical protein JSW12_14290 [Deltaproteobacteria bacterium]|nr:MAG: hypothetical protein JSW12_14290 [Deltaproteobacteria bacterium]